MERGRPARKKNHEAGETPALQYAFTPTTKNGSAAGEAVWLHRRDETATLTLHVQPGARRTEVAGTHGDALKIRLAAPPVDGKANAALIEFIAARLTLPKSAVRLVGGQTSRRKILEIEAAPLDAEQRLLPAGTQS
jgi:uncharacterized protein (TIGR00251 family)